MRLLVFMSACFASLAQETAEESSLFAAARYHDYVTSVTARLRHRDRHPKAPGGSEDRMPPEDWERLGFAIAELGEHELALSSYRRAGDRQTAHINHGHSLVALGREEEAIEVFRKATAAAASAAAAAAAAGPTADDNAILATAFLNLGATLANVGRADEASSAYASAIKAEPANVVALHYRARALLASGDGNEAKQLFARILEIEPRHSAALHFATTLGININGAGGDGNNSNSNSNGSSNDATAAFVAEEFDAMAETFERKLVGKLRYQVPRLLYEVMLEAAGSGDGGGGDGGGGDGDGNDNKVRLRDLVIVDAGVGTGLVGPLVAPHAARLLGIDLSPEMVKKARARTDVTYDELVVGDVVEALGPRGSIPISSVDVVVAADTVVYLGELGPLFGVVTRVLRRRPGAAGTGAFVFSTELPPLADNDGTGGGGDDDDDGWAWRPSGRCAHTRKYVLRLAREHGLEVAVARTAVGRFEKGEPVNVDLFVLVLPIDRPPPPSRIQDEL